MRIHSTSSLGSPSKTDRSHAYSNSGSTAIVLALICALAWCPSHVFAQSNDKPNILFIAVDDLRPELGCYGVEAIKTPAIDAFARSGVRFTRAYCQMAVCNPSRVSVLTGLRPDSTKVWDLRTRFRETIPDAVTLPAHFMRHGYRAESYGKIFHNPWPDNQSWSVPHGWPPGRRLWSDDARAKLARFKEKMRADGKTKRQVDRMRGPATEVVDMPDRQHTDGAIARQTLQAMRRLAKQGQPFFLATGFVRPHLPFVVPRKYWELYDANEIPLTNQTDLPKDAPEFAMNTMYELRDYMDFYGTPRPDVGSLSEIDQRRLKHGYYASVSLIDAQIGLLLRELESLEMSENTVVVLWSDHGWKLGEHNSWCKQTNYEIDTRVPLIIRAPNATSNGLNCDSLVELIDIYPTLCELAGLPSPKELEGRSMTPLLSNPNQPFKSEALSQFRRRRGQQSLMGYAVRTARYRFVEWLDRQSGETIEMELYDHNVDPQERTNIAGVDANRDTIAKLRTQLRSRIAIPLKSKNPAP